MAAEAVEAVPERGTADSSPDALQACAGSKQASLLMLSLVVVKAAAEAAALVPPPSAQSAV